MKEGKLQYFLLLNFAMLCISTSGVLGSKLLLYAPLGIWGRCVFAVFFLGFYCKIKKFNFTLKKGKSANMVFVSGLLMTAHWVSYFFALNYTNVAVSMLAVFTYPMMTTLLEPLFFNVKLQLRSVLLCLLILAGVYFLLPSFSFENSDTKGFLLGMLSAGFYSFRNLLLKREIESYNGSVLMFYQSAIAIIVLLPVFFFAQPDLDVIIHDLPYLVGLGLITTSLGHTIFLNSFSYFKISTASILSSLQPVFGIILAIIFLNEIPSWRSVMGGAVIMFSVLIESLASAQKKE